LLGVFLFTKAGKIENGEFKECLMTYFFDRSIFKCLFLLGIMVDLDMVRALAKLMV
jgi:hypothetical protein